MTVMIMMLQQIMAGNNKEKPVIFMLQADLGTMRQPGTKI